MPRATRRMHSLPCTTVFYAFAMQRNRSNLGPHPSGLPRIRLSPWIALPVLVIFVAALWRNTDDDVHRYFAYCNAALGRPFNSFYVRSYETWQDDFTTGKVGSLIDFPTVVPSRPLVPYRDFLVEYPPGFFIAALPPALLTTNEGLLQGIVRGVDGRLPHRRAVLLRSNRSADRRRALHVRFDLLGIGWRRSLLEG